MTTQTWMIVMILLSMLSMLGGAIFLNRIKGLQSYLFDPNWAWKYRILMHQSGGICGLGMFSGWLWMIVLLAELILVSRNDIKALKKFNPGLGTLVGLYIVALFIMNSTFDYRVLRPSDWEGYKGVGMFEYMLPFYVFQIVFLVLVATDVE